VNIINNNYNVEIDRALENKFRLSLNFDEIYVDFDDCLIINNEINTSLVYFLYQALNQNKKIILLSKHDGDIESALKKCRLKDIFDEIIHLKKNDNKYKYIKNTRAIFIDDSFAERKEIKEKIGINVFAPDMIENLEVINE
jgi:DNA-directed RNA polymerase delta subunit